MSIGIEITTEIATVIATAPIGFAASRSSARANWSGSAQLSKHAVGNGSASELNAAVMCTDILRIMGTAEVITVAITAADTTTAKSNEVIAMGWIEVRRMRAIAGPSILITRATIDPETLRTATVSAEAMKSAIASIMVDAGSNRPQNHELSLERTDP